MGLRGVQLGLRAWEVCTNRNSEKAMKKITSSVLTKLTVLMDSAHYGPHR